MKNIDKGKRRNRLKAANEKETIYVTQRGEDH